MSYVQRVLQSGEEVRYLAGLHWILYLPGVVFVVAAGVVLFVARNAEHANYFWLIAAGGLGLVALYLLFHAWFDRWTTEIAVTNRRIIYKTGFIRRETNEMHMDKVESVRVDQSVLGRLLDYGDVNVIGTGTGFEPLRRIAAPLDLRNHITGV